jgi:hypothetical protein
MLTHQEDGCPLLNSFMVLNLKAARGRKNA